MAEHSTFIKLDRNIMRWRWYKNGPVLRLFIHLLFKANVTDNDFEDITVKRGQVVTSIHQLSEQTGLSEKQVRTALEHLKSTNEVASTSSNRYTLITLVNYDAYQSVGANKRANKGQTDGNQKAIKGQQYKNNKKDNANALSKNEKKGAPAPVPADAVLEPKEWELRRRLPSDMWGDFQSEEEYEEWRVAH